MKSATGRRRALGPTLGREPKGKSLDALVAFALKLAAESGKILGPANARRPQVELKADRSLVTRIDKRIERRLRGLIAARYPDHGILGEEAGGTNVEADLLWVIDPIDGTAPFVAGIPVFGTLIAVLYRGTPIIGIIDHPVTRDRWVGVRGRATTRNGVRCKTRRCPGVKDALLSASNPDFFGPSDRPGFEALRSRTQWRIYGGSCFSYGLLASGRTDIAIDTGLSIHDYAAFRPVIEGAGGVITDWNGAPITIETGKRILAAGDAARHKDALALVQAAMKPKR
ncbi:MAG: inositol monophosphatase family protein [Alphaproteobacteria bacterium]|nr:inositol monophosphatase family protein [Alphaproteobacteria bacterium]